MLLLVIPTYIKRLLKNHSSFLRSYNKLHSIVIQLAFLTQTHIMTNNMDEILAGLQMSMSVDNSFEVMRNINAAKMRAEVEKFKSYFFDKDESLKPFYDFENEVGDVIEKFRESQFDNTENGKLLHDTLLNKLKSYKGQMEEFANDKNVLNDFRFPILYKCFSDHVEMPSLNLDTK